MTMKRLKVLALILTLAMVGCSTPSQNEASLPPYPDDEDILGGPPWVLPPGEQGSAQTAAKTPDIAIPLEGLAGTWSGSRLSESLSQQIRLKMIEVTQMALNQASSGEKVKWRSGSLEGTVTPQMMFTGPGERECREFHQMVRKGKTVETGYGTACLADGGQWRMLIE